MPEKFKRKLFDVAGNVSHVSIAKKSMTMSGIWCAIKVFVCIVAIKNEHTNVTCAKHGLQNNTSRPQNCTIKQEARPCGVPLVMNVSFAKKLCAKMHLKMLRRRAYSAASTGLAQRAGKTNHCTPSILNYSTTHRHEKTSLCVSCVRKAVSRQRIAKHTSVSLAGPKAI